MGCSCKNRPNGTTPRQQIVKPSNPLHNGNGVIQKRAIR